MSTVIICTGMCWMRLARAMDGSKEGSANVIQEWDITAQLHPLSICRKIFCEFYSQHSPVEEMIAKTSCRDGSIVAGSAFHMFWSSVLTFVTCPTYSLNSRS